MDNSDALLLKITDDIKRQYGCHTVILYGSRARGDVTDTSDYDIIAIRENGEFQRDCKLINGFYLDAFIYSEESIKQIDDSLIRIKDGKVICQKDSIGDLLLKTINDRFIQGAPKTPDWEKNEISVWARKMLNRAKKDDIEGSFRRHWLLHDLLECYFKMRDIWFLGSKESFDWLKNNDAATYFAFKVALKFNSNNSEIEELIERVTDLKIIC